MATTIIMHHSYAIFVYVFLYTPESSTQVTFLGLVLIISFEVMSTTHTMQAKTNDSCFKSLIIFFYVYFVCAVIVAKKY